MKKIFAMIAITLGMSYAAKAGIMIEPYLGYHGGDTVYQFTTLGGGGPEYTDTASGTGFGLRLGYKFLLPWVALDYATFNGTYKDGVPGNSNYDYSMTNMSVVVGVDLPIMLRAWAGYGFSDKGTLKFTSSETKTEGTSTKIGLGFKGFPFVSINAEYIMTTPTKLDYGHGSGKEDVDLYYKSLKPNFFLISVSVPWNL